MNEKYDKIETYIQKPSTVSSREIIEVEKLTVSAFSLISWESFIKLAEQHNRAQIFSIIAENILGTGLSEVWGISEDESEDTYYYFLLENHLICSKCNDLGSDSIKQTLKQPIAKSRPFTH